MHHFVSDDRRKPVVNSVKLFFQNSFKVREFQFVIINTNIALKNGSINQKVNFCGLCGCHADFKLSTNSMTFNAVKIIKQHYFGRWDYFFKGGQS